VGTLGIAQEDDGELRAAGYARYETPSPFIHFIGGLWSKVEGERAFVAMRIRDPHCNSFGSIHGGMLLALSDQLIAMSSRLLTGRAGMTMHVNADFLDAAPAGTVLYGEGRVLRATRSTAFLEGHWFGEGRPVLRVSGLVRLMGDADGPRRAPGLERWGDGKAAGEST
jgi:uncharacterized protein (TIGR00369 family)